MEELCRCGNPLVMRTSWTDANPGRRFLACGNFRKLGSCNQFMWTDPPACARCSQIIPGLLRNMNSKAEELEMLEKKLAVIERIKFKLWVALSVGVLVVGMLFFKK